MLKMDQKLDDTIFIKYVDSPLGIITITTNETHLLSLNFNEVNEEQFRYATLPTIMTNTLDQLTRYFNKTLTTFNLSLHPTGTNFQKNVWQTLQTIQLGSVLSYQKLAEQIESISKTRPVASAIAKNPILIIIPCHRVLGSNGKLTGYSGGIERKRQLLLHEELINYNKTLLF